MSAPKSNHETLLVSLIAVRNGVDHKVVSHWMFETVRCPMTADSWHEQQHEMRNRFYEDGVGTRLNLGFSALKERNLVMNGPYVG